MDKIMSVQLMIVVLICLLIGSLAETIKVINSTEINNIKLPPPPEDKTGSVYYVYPTVEEKENSINLTRNCYVKVVENGTHVIYNQTREEVEKLGKFVLEENCTSEGDKIGPGLIASLGGG